MAHRNTTLLKVVSIIMIVAGVLDVIFGLLPILFGSVMRQVIIATATAATANASAIATLAGSGLIVALGIVVLLAGIFRLIAGILGVKAANGKDCLKTARVFAVVILICAIISVVLEVLVAIGTPGLLTKSTSALVSLTIPILYRIGVKQAEETVE